MTIEQHAEAAAEEIDRSMTDGPKAIIAKHMQSAIDEALAEKMISVLDNASNHVHEVDLLKARIAALEGLGPLIEEYADSGIVMANAIHTKSPERQKRASERRREALAKIDAILKGGAS